MNTTEFEHWVKLGLGRAVTRLRAEADKSPFYDTVLRIAERQSGYTHACGHYIRELISCFDGPRKTALETAAINAAGSVMKNPGAYHIAGADLLAAYAANGSEEARDKLEALYSSLYAELAARSERPERDCDKAEAYMLLAFSLATSLGAERLPGLLRDMAALFERRAFFSEADFTTFFNNARFKLGKAFDDTLDSLRGDSPEVARLADRMAELRKIERGYIENPDSRPVLDNWSFDALYKKLKNGEGVLDVQDYDNLGKLTREQRERIAELALDCPESERLEVLLSVFANNIVPWPLEPAPLVMMARDHLQYLTGETPVSDEIRLKKNRLAHKLLLVLRNLRGDTVRELAFELVGRGLLKEGVSLWARNYRAEDRERFTEAFKQIESPVDPHRDGTPIFGTLDMITNGGYGEGNAPAELLEYIYERAPDCNPRFVAVMALHSLGLLDENLTEECRHDNFELIHEYVESIKTKK